MNILWEWIWPAWLVLCWLLQVSKKDPLRGLSAHIYMGIATYLPLLPFRASFICYSGSKLMQCQFIMDHPLIITVGLLTLVQASFCGWITSPGAIPFLLAPYRVLLLAGGRSISDKQPIWTEDKRLWSRESWKFAIFMATMTIVIGLVALRLFPI